MIMKQLFYTGLLILALITVGCGNQSDGDVTVIDDNNAEEETNTGDTGDTTEGNTAETGDSNEEEGTDGQEPSKDESQEELEVESIDVYENVYMTGWLDDNRVLSVKENETLDKLSLAELEEFYPTSIYSYDIDTDTYELIVADETMNLGEATVSENGNYLIYSANTLGDPVYRVYNIHNGDSFQLSGDPIGGAMSAQWVAGNDIIGSAYAGSVYLADVSGDMRLVEGMTDSMVFLLGKAEDDIIYNTNSEPQLVAYTVDTEEKTPLPFEDARGLKVSPKGDQLLVSNGEDTEVILYQYDRATDTTFEIDRGLMVGATSFSPSQRYVAYSMMTSEQPSTSTLYVYDFVTDNKIEIGVADTFVSTVWSSEEDKLIYSTYDGNAIHSSIVSFTQMADE